MICTISRFSGLLDLRLWVAVSDREMLGKASFKSAFPENSPTISRLRRHALHFLVSQEKHDLEQFDESVRMSRYQNSCIHTSAVSCSHNTCFLLMKHFYTTQDNLRWISDYSSIIPEVESGEGGTINWTLRNLDWIYPQWIFQFGWHGGKDGNDLCQLLTSYEKGADLGTWTWTGRRAEQPHWRSVEAGEATRPEHTGACHSESYTTSIPSLTLLEVKFYFKTKWKILKF